MKSIIRAWHTIDVRGKIYLLIVAVIMARMVWVDVRRAYEIDAVLHNQHDMMQKMDGLKSK